MMTIMETRIIRFVVGYLLTFAAMAIFRALNWIHILEMESGSKLLILALTALICWLMVCLIGYFINAVRLFAIGFWPGFISLALIFILLAELNTRGVVFASTGFLVIARSHIGTVVMGMVYSFVFCLTSEQKTFH